MLPPRDQSGERWLEDIESSERVLVRIEHSKHLWFARYFYKSQTWSIEGCVGEFKVLEWWPLPKTPGTKLGD